MGLQKLGITLAEQCARYAKACGKSNILCTKPVHISNIEGLRYASGLTEDVVKLEKPLSKFWNISHSNYGKKFKMVLDLQFAGGLHDTWIISN